VPGRSEHGLADPLDEGLAQEARAGPAPADAGLVPVAFGDRGDASVLLQRGGVWEALAALTKGHEQSRSDVPCQRPAAPGKARSRAARRTPTRSRRRSVRWRRKRRAAAAGVSRQAELVSITCSGLQIRRQRLHVPLPILATTRGMKARTDLPMSGFAAAGLPSCQVLPSKSWLSTTTSVLSTITLRWSDGARS
jgi:hypothetical protein